MVVQKRKSNRSIIIESSSNLRPYIHIPIQAHPLCLRSLALSLYLSFIRLSHSRTYKRIPARTLGGVTVNTQIKS